MDRSVARIIDANLNRAREALRVIEEYARFALNDVAAAARAKSLRHSLRTLVPEDLRALGLTERDAPGDIGRTLKTDSEALRAAPLDILKAAFARFSEACRVLEEYAKLVSPQAVPKIESLRFAGYELEPLLLVRSARRARFREVQLYVIITAAPCRREWLATAEAVLKAGAQCLQLREKEIDDRELLARAKQLRELTGRYQRLLIINDRPDIARLSGADGVHLGQDDLSVIQARPIAGNELLIGKSTHTPPQFIAAIDEQPDYIAIGPMFPTRTKPQNHVAGLESLRNARSQAPAGTSLVAIGGIDQHNARDVVAAGADCICVCSAVLSAEDPAAPTRELLARISKAG